MSNIFVQVVLSGATAGLTYGLMAMGFSLIYRTSRLLNLAQGTFAVLAAYVATSVVGWGYGLVVAVLVGVLASGAVALASEFMVLRHLYDRPLAVAILATLGIAVTLQAVIQLVWGPLPLSLDSLASNTPIAGNPFGVTSLQVVILLISLATAITLIALVDYTRVGRAMRACAQDPEVIRLFGIDSRSMYLLSFVVGGALAGIAGILILPSLGLLPSRGIDLTVLGFTAAVLGGLGSLVGAILGGVVVGIIYNLAAVYVSATYAPGILYLLLALVLVVRVQGLLGDKLEGIREI